MSTAYTGPLDRVHGAMDELAAISPEFRTTAEKQEHLVGVSRLIARAEAERLRVLASADDIADVTGARSTATWLANETRDGHGVVRRHAALAASLARRWVQVAEAFAAGDVNLSQTQVIAEALDALPQDLGDDLLVKAESLLVTEAAKLGPRELKVFGSRVLDYLAPDIAEEAEYQKLLAAERRAQAATKLFFRPRGDGSTDVNARIPDHVANRLRTYLDGYASPRNKRLGDVDELPLSRRRGEAFCAFLENLPASGLPRQGGTATTVTVTIDWKTLLADLGTAGVAVTSTGDRITADQARRLACQAWIMPFVMSGKSVIHDQGRAKRLFQDELRIALNLLYPECTAVGCSIPAAWCEAHHTVPWSKGGKTRLQDEVPPIFWRRRCLV
jgi:hypothetical protein